MTPLYSVLNAVYRARDASFASVQMIYSNKTEADILLRAELDAINADETAPHIQVTHTLTRATGEVTGGNVCRGRVSVEMLQSLGFPAPGPDVFFYICGPVPFNEACKAMLKAAGYLDSMVFV